VHPAGIVVVTPSGRIGRYLPGVRFDAGVLRAALSDAAVERIGDRTDPLLLLCAHFDPATGRHGGIVMNALRAVGMALAFGLAAYAWRHRRPEQERAR
jgi:protein SCO1/2